MATSCCRRQQVSARQAASASPRRARIAVADSAQDSRSEAPAAVHQDHRQKSPCCGDSSSAAALAARTSERVAVVARERERSRPLHGRLGLAGMEHPKASYCLLDWPHTETRDVPARWSPASLSHSLARLCANWLGSSSDNALSNCQSKQMPLFDSNDASQSNFHNQNHNQNHNSYSRVPVPFARNILLITIYLALALELTSASLMSALVDGANSANRQPPSKPGPIPSESSLAGSSKLARQILASHYQNQILSHVQSQVATTSAQHEQPHLVQPSHQATTNAASWPQYEEFGAGQSGAGQYGAHQHQLQTHADAAVAPAELSAWSSSTSEQQAAPSHPGPPVNQPHRASGGPPFAIPQPTTPTLNKQLAPPPPFYDFGLMPTSVLQLETVPAPNAQQQQQQVAQTAPDNQGAGRYELAHGHHQNQPRNHYATSPMASVISGMHDGVHQHQQQMMQAAESAVAAQLAKMPAHNNSSGSSWSGNSRDSRAMMGPPAGETLGKSIDPQDGSGEPTVAATDGQGGVSSSNSQNSDSKFDNNNHDQQQQQQQQSGPVDKGIEPRQRRRMFNRILKKAEWNHLFVELSKVFLRYFLDLALKDIIGKQSGALGSSSSSSGDSTTGRKKLDAQSELADMLKEFVKTAISNLR